jgi:hypothetical protein
LGVVALASAIAMSCGDSFEAAGDKGDAAVDASGGTGATSTGGSAASVATGGANGTGSGGSPGSGGAAGSGGSSGTGGALGSGGAAGSAGGTGSAGASGNAGSGGAQGAAADAGPGPERDCVANANPNSASLPDPERLQLTRGVNGEFVDTCDPSGNLIDYHCETKTICDQPPNPVCNSFQTGKVISQSFDCNGHCSNGRCNARCPAVGDPWIYESIAADGQARFKLLDGSRHYQCSLIFDRPQDPYDCRTSPTVGEVAIVASLGLTNQFCTGGQIGNIGFPNCTYSCQIVN